ncbi:HAMP domain-containing histidine kinase [Bifidobacterium tissieri]|uniref:histidine kinase n=2 Tax=Bifidobacterium TaxID=1678 RepID=A0A5M9ZT56_9BIFI|nr:HAMP domain-containing histidine kinase [Bifidobacterium tissieri]KAA8832828.1 HAMP domain-containing histidine kinase [Bifidobacterium tissieri]
MPLNRQKPSKGKPARQSRPVRRSGESQGLTAKLDRWRDRPIGMFSSLKAELSILITLSTAIAFVLAWHFLKWGWSGWLAMPLTLVVALGITYFFAHGLTAPLRQMRDAAEAMAAGDYTVRVESANDSRDEVGQLARSFNEMAEELQHADQMRRDMVANVSHELRTPVSALQALVENMADGVVEPTPANLEGILDQTHKLSDLIAFLLDMSRVEAGAASLEIEPFDFAEFIDDTVKPLEIADGGHGHTIHVDVPEHLRMEGDPNRLSQLFTNVIANALKHSPDGTEVLIETHENEERGTVITNVVNYGSRIPEEARNDIFRRYVKGTGRPGTGSGGTGLGLSIARWAAGLHGGTVNVVPDPRGANFEIELPKYPTIDDE